MIKVSFLGDISLNGNYNTLFKNGESPFKVVNRFLIPSDYVVGNLECLADGEFGENLLKFPRLKTDVRTLSYLTQIPVNIVTLAHNHIFDNLIHGYDRTLEKLTALNVESFGAGLSIVEASKPYQISKSGINICFLNYVTIDTNPAIPSTVEYYVNLFDLNNVENEIQKNKKSADFVVILLHWGGRVENEYFPEPIQTKQARMMIDAGADLIVGHHSHTLQPYEIYKNKYIFYSLGNFCFDNITSNGKQIEIDWKRNTEAVIINIYFLKAEYLVKIIPIRNKNCFLETDKNILKKLCRRNFFLPLLKINFFWSVYHFYVKSINPIHFHFFGNNRNWITEFKKVKMSNIIKHIRSITS